MQNIQPIEKLILAPPPTVRTKPSLATYDNSYIFVIGGSIIVETSDQDSMDMYTIHNDTWSSAPALNMARSEHSSCIAGHTLCVFGGESRRGHRLKCIEIIDVRAVVRG